MLLTCDIHDIKNASRKDTAKSLLSRGPESCRVQPSLHYCAFTDQQRENAFDHMVTKITASLLMIEPIWLLYEYCCILLQLNNG